MSEEYNTISKEVTMLHESMNDMKQQYQELIKKKNEEIEFLKKKLGDSKELIDIIIDKLWDWKPSDCGGRGPI